MHENRGRRPKGGTPVLTKLTVYREGLKHTAHGVKMTLLLGFGDRGWFRAVLPPLLSILPPLLSMLPSILSTFDAPLVAGAGGEKRASYQSEQEQSCDRLSGDRGEGVFHTT